MTVHITYICLTVHYKYTYATAAAAADDDDHDGDITIVQHSTITKHGICYGKYIHPLVNQ